MQDAEPRTPPVVKQHLDPEVLALIGAGEDAASADVTAHLERCRACSAEVEQYSTVAAIARGVQDEGQLVEPPAHVWSAIRSELGLSPEARAADEVGRRPPAAMVVGIAAAAVFALILGGTLVWQFLRPPDAEVIATATLEPLPDGQGAVGTAVLEERAEGGRAVTVALEVSANPGGYTEVWLLTADASGLVSLGVLQSGIGTFAVPNGIDIDDYPLLDVSYEPLDGDPTHSGNSVARGQFS